MSDVELQLLLREQAPQVLSALVRHYGHFDLAEEAVQEALLAAAQQWPDEGVPDNPRGWLIRVGSRRLTDLLRSESARRRREENAAQLRRAGGVRCLRPRDRRSGRPGRHADSAVPVLPSGVVAGLADRA